MRVTGPFTVEAVQPPEMSLDEASDPMPTGKFAGEPDGLETFHQVRPVELGESA